MTWDGGLPPTSVRQKGNLELTTPERNKKRPETMAKMAKKNKGKSVLKLLQWNKGNASIESRLDDIKNYLVP